MADQPANLIQLAQTAMQPEKQEPGPGDVGPTVQTPADPQTLVTLPMTPDEVQEWWKRVNESDERLKPYMEIADILLDEYMPIVVKSGEAEAVKSNKHFRNTHTKIGSLFYRTPELLLESRDPGPANNQLPNPMQAMSPVPLPPLTMEDVISVKQAVLNDTMGPDGINAGRLMDQLLFDALQWAGFGVCKVGHKATWKPIQRPKLGPDPNFNPMANQSMLGLQGPQQAPLVPQVDAFGQPIMETVPVPIHREWYARRFSPKKYICNTDLFSTDVEKDATFNGMHFYMSPKVAMRDLGLTEDEASKLAEDDKRHKFEKLERSNLGGLVHGVELWPKLSYFTDEVHPLAIGQLVLIEGLERPVIWRPSPDQTFGPDGKLTQDSLTGLPIKLITLRDLADSAFPQADAAFTNSGIKQIGTWRRQSVQMRDVNIGKFLYDSGAFDDTEVNSLQKANVGDYVSVAEGRMAQGVDKIIGITPQIKSTADDFRAQELMDKENDETLGISPNQAGGQQDNVISATEVATINAAIQARNEKELNRVVESYLAIVRAIDQLLMRYADQDEYVNVGGDEGARRIMMWNKRLIAGRYLYKISPDSQLKVDSSRDFQLLLNFYNLAAPDPIFNRAYCLRKLARMRGLDPSKVVLNPTQQMVQPPHGGPTTQGTTVNQHVAGESGGRPNAPGAVNHRQEQAGGAPAKQPNVAGPAAQPAPRV